MEFNNIYAFASDMKALSGKWDALTEDEQAAIQAVFNELPLNINSVMRYLELFSGRITDVYRDSDCIRFEGKEWLLRYIFHKPADGFVPVAAESLEKALDKAKTRNFQEALAVDECIYCYVPDSLLYKPAALLEIYLAKNFD